MHSNYSGKKERNVNYKFNNNLIMIYTNNIYSKNPNFIFNYDYK